MSKIHFLDVAEPDLQEGSDLVANCGALIKNVAFAMRFDFELGNIVDWNTILCCSECLIIEFDERFIYGLISVREVLDETANARAGIRRPGPSL